MDSTQQRTISRRSQLELRPDESRVGQLLSLVGESWPKRMPERDAAGLPRGSVETLGLGRFGAALDRIAGRLDRELSGWTEIAAEALAAAAPDGLSPELKRACAVLGRRPVHRPNALVAAALGGRAADAECRVWLLTALAGTDTARLRDEWRSWLRARIGEGSEGPDCACWFVFLRAFLGGWLSARDFHDCLARGRVLAAAAPRGDYRRALKRLRLWGHPAFSKWYRQVVYEVANQPDVSLSLHAGGWIRDFPGEYYFWDAVARLRESPNSWWHLHVVRWASGVDGNSPGVARRLRGLPAQVRCLISLVRADLHGALASAVSTPQHEAVVRWLMMPSADRPLDLEWVENVLRPWSEELGEAMTLAVGAICSVDPPSDFEGPDTAALRRRAFLRKHIIPEFDHLMDNLCWLHALRRTHFSLICRETERGRPAAARSLAVWPEKAEESAPLLFRLSRRGTRSARRAAREALDVLISRARVPDLDSLERRVDLASAWSDAGLEGKPARVWWDIAGYRVKLSVADGAVAMQAFTGSRRLATLPKAVRQDPRYAEIRDTRAKLARSYRYFRRRFEEAMVEGVRYSGRDFATLMRNPVVRSLISRLVLLVDGAPFLCSPADPLDDCTRPAEIERAEWICAAHPLALSEAGALEEWQARIVESRIAQPFKQVFREVYVAAERERAGADCRKFAGHPLVARRAFALLRSRGYSPRQGDAVRDWPRHGMSAHIQWAGASQSVGRLLAAGDAAEPVTSGRVWFENDGGEPVPLAEVNAVLFSETLRDADLLVSRAAPGEMGFSSEETRCLRATLVRYLTRALGLTTVYVGDDCGQVIVEGSRAMYRVNLGSGSVLLEKTRRHLDVGALVGGPLRDLIGESMDSQSARILGIIIALSQDHTITEPEFLRQLADDSSSGGDRGNVL